jgi:hypothetical protein
MDLYDLFFAKVVGNVSRDGMIAIAMKTPIKEKDISVRDAERNLLARTV